jgi:hypothetical protein
MEQKNNLSVKSGFEKEKKIGDHVFSADFVNENGKYSFEIKEYEVKKIVADNITKNKCNSYYEIIDLKFPKVNIKSDLKVGFFDTEKEAVIELVKSIKSVSDKAIDTIREVYGISI